MNTQICEPQWCGSVRGLALYPWPRKVVRKAVRWSRSVERIASSEILFAEQRDSTHLVQTIVWLRHLLCSLPFIVGSRIHLRLCVDLPVSKQNLPARICAVSLQFLCCLSFLHRDGPPSAETKPGKAGILEYPPSTAPFPEEHRRNHSPVVSVGGTQTLKLVVTPRFSQGLLICCGSCPFSID